MQGGFTLVEMLVVIAIIGLLAALVLGGIGIATTNMRRSRAESERDALVTAIDSYKKARGFYPPDNTNDPVCVQNPLFYELTGMILNGNNSYQSVVSGEILTAAQIGNLFKGGVAGGFINTSNSVDSPSQNFYPGLKAGQKLLLPVAGFGSYTVLGTGVPGPVSAMLPKPNGSFNPWHYNASHPTNNVDSYDLWVDVSYAGKTNRISNWSKDPQIVSW